MGANCWRVSRAASWARTAALPALLAGCADGLPTGTDPARTELTLAVSMVAAASRIGYPVQQFELRIQPYYERRGRDAAPIGAPHVVALGTAATHRVPVAMTVDQSSCASDTLRTPAGAGCPLRLDVDLVLANGGLVLDHQLVGPLAVSGARHSLADTLRLIEVGVPEVLPAAPVLTVGSSMQLAARFVTVRGDTVSRPVTWRSDAPGIALVDANAVLAGIAPGRTFVHAHFGHGQSSYGVPVTVNAP